VNKCNVGIDSNKVCHNYVDFILAIILHAIFM